MSPNYLELFLTSQRTSNVCTNVIRGFTSLRRLKSTIINSCVQAQSIGRGLGPQVTWTSCPEQGDSPDPRFTFQYLLYYTPREHGWFNLQFYTFTLGTSLGFVGFVWDGLCHVALEFLLKNPKNPWTNGTNLAIPKLFASSPN